jgi:hypothetical protein
MRAYALTRTMSRLDAKAGADGARSLYNVGETGIADRFRRASPD